MQHVVGNVYADERVGLYIIRGENLVLLGELVPPQLSSL